MNPSRFPRVMPLALLGLALALAGCSFYNEEEQAEYDRVYAASREVLSRYFDVRDSQFVEGHLIAYSRIANQFGEQQRYKVDVSVDRDEEGFFHPHVQVLQEMNLSVVDPSKNSRAQRNPKWVATDFDRRLETRIANEIADLVNGHTGTAGAEWFAGDADLMARQRQIDAARANYRAAEAGGAPAPSAPPASGPLPGSGPVPHSTPGMR